MIVVETSALMAIILDEPQAESCSKVLCDDADLKISAATVTEALIVATRRDCCGSMTALLDGLGLEIVPVTANSARRAADAYARWGKGVHLARLNFGDCFAYELAASRGCGLLFVGDDFRKTDIVAAL